ncbi:NAD(P)-binding domain-containing protein [Streptomyces sp. L7]
MNSTDSEPLDYLVIGGGPAGLQLGQLLQAAGHGYRILESGRAPGTFFRTFPRHRKLISINKTLQRHRRSRAESPDGLELPCCPRTTGCCSPATARRYFPHADDLVRYPRRLRRGVQAGHRLRHPGGVDPASRRPASPSPTSTGRTITPDAS